MSERVKVCVIVGNGFDMAAGLGTSTEAFVARFAEQHAGEDSPAGRLAAQIAQDGPKTWADFERKLGEYAAVVESTADDAVGEYVDLDTLLAQSDVVSLHCNLTPENTGLINKETIAKMKGGAILLNNARGQLIVEQDVADALNSGKLAAAGLDVVYTEPIRPDNPLLTAKNCILTPHISWAPKESRQRIMEITAENIRAFLNGTPQNVVNP